MNIMEYEYEFCHYLTTEGERDGKNWKKAQAPFLNLLLCDMPY